MRLVLSAPIPTLDLSAVRRPCDEPSLGEGTAEEIWLGAIEQGLVPRDWLDDPRRVFPNQRFTFFCDACGGMGATGYNYDDVCNVCVGKGQTTARSALARPACKASSMWMLSHPAIVLRAEELAREAMRRLPSSPGLDRIQWGRRNESSDGRIPLVIRSPIWDRVRFPSWDWEQMKGPAFERAPWYDDARVLFSSFAFEMFLSDVGGAWMSRAEGNEASAFEPLLELWQLGIVFEEILEDRIVLDRACRRAYVETWRAGVPLG